MAGLQAHILLHEVSPTQKLPHLPLQVKMYIKYMAGPADMETTAAAAAAAHENGLTTG